MQNIHRFACALFAFIAIVPQAYAVKLRADITWDQPQPVIADVQIRNQTTEEYAVSGFYPPYYYPLPNDSFTLDGIPGSTITGQGYGQSITFTLDPVYSGTFAFSAMIDCNCYNRAIVTAPVTTMTIKFYEDDVFVRQVQHTFLEWGNDWEIIVYYPSDPPRFAFEYDSAALPGKILLHDYTGAGAYSNYQVIQGSPTDPAVIRVPGLVTSGGQPVDIPVFFRVIDPPDKAPYATAVAKADDNLDTSNKKGRLYYVDDNGQRINANASGILKLPGKQLGIKGWVDARLEVTDRYAGDNYVVEASFEAGFSCHATNSCPTSALWTAWKRAYLEVDQMWQSGALVAETSPANSTSVYVDDRHAFQRGDAVMLSHAPDFSRRGTPNFYEEGPFTIVDINKNHNSAIKATWELVLDRPHQFEYRRDIAVSGLQLADGVANVTGSSLFSATGQYLNTLFKDAFVEYVTLPSSGVHVPLYEGLTPQQELFVGLKWFRARNSTNAPPNSGVVIVAATRSTTGLSSQALSLGTTAGTVVSMVWRESIDSATSSKSIYTALKGHNANLVADEVLVHEIGHQWSVNPLYQDHECSQPSRMAYDNPAKFCQMNSPNNASQYDDNHVAFHFYVDSYGTVDSEYFTIRTQPEPKP